MFTFGWRHIGNRNGRFLLLLAAILFLSITTITITTMAAPSGSFSCSMAVDVTEAECDALVDLYLATDENGWTLDQNWLQSTAVCSWYGVTCSDNKVTSLFLHENNLFGYIPNSIGDLIYLESIYMSQNQLTGKMPASLATLPNLEELDLFDNRLSGGLPSSYTSPNLRLLTLGSNNFLVRLPPTWGDNMDSLENLDLSDNYLIGDIPEEWADMDSLKLFHFDGTYLCQHDKSDVDDWLAKVESLEVSGHTCALSVSDLSIAQQTAYADESGVYMVNIPITLPAEGLAREAPNALEAVNLVVEINSAVSVVATFPDAQIIEDNFYVWDFLGSDAEEIEYVTLALRSNSGEAMPDAAFQYILTTVANSTVEINTTAVTLSSEDGPPSIYLPFIRN